MKDQEVKQWLAELKVRIRQSQIRAMVKVNDEMLRLYWDLGRDIVVRQMESVWGSGFLRQLSKELKSEFPDMQGFSERNLYLIKQFYSFYNQEDIILHQVGAELGDENLHQVGAEKEVSKIIRHQVGDELKGYIIFQIPWRHQVEIFTKCKLVEEALFYVQKTIQNGWSRAMLMIVIIAYVGRQYPIQIGNKERYIDLLFYHLELRCYVVCEVKVQEFQPEHTGKLGFYIAAVNHQLKKAIDNPTIGMLIVKKKDNIEAKYSLESSSQPIGISAYTLSKLIPEDFKSSLPSIEEIEFELNKGE